MQGRSCGKTGPGMWMLSRCHGSLNSLGKLKPRKVRSLSRGHSTRANLDLPHNPATEGVC